VTLSFDEAIHALRVNPPIRSNGPAEVIVSTDSRTLRSGETFLALRGERFDGHQYVESAVQHGAAALIVERPPEKAVGVPVFLVDDTLSAYMKLAAAARAKLHATVIAVTGSTGKTTTKSLLGQILQRNFGEHVTISPANENNEIGVSKLFLNAPIDARVIVVEMGARHYGDIATLVNVALPEIGILTNIREAHLEIMQSRERLAETKWALFSAGARAVLNVRDPESLRRARALQEAPRWFGAGMAELPKTHARERGVFLLDAGRLRLIDGDRDVTYDVDVRLPGEYNLENLAAAIAGALEAGCAPEAIAANLSDLSLPSGRYETIVIANAPRIIFDAYNASASGTIATLDAFAHEKGRRRVAILGSMAELGDSAPELHRQVGAHAARAGIDFILVGGDHASDLRSGAQDAGLHRDRIADFYSTAQAAKWIRENTTPDDVILLKGSRRYKLEQVLEELQK